MGAIMKSKQEKGMGEISRRNFLKVSAAAGAGVLFAANGLSAKSPLDSDKTKYALVGTGHRSRMYQEAIYKTFKDNAVMVALCDLNKGRLTDAQKWCEEAAGYKPPIYDAKDFDIMIKEADPDFVIVTTVCGTHDKYIVRAMELGKDVITEKAMTTDEKKCQSIVDAQTKTGKKVKVTFNYRYSPPRTQVKDLLMSGVIGDILSVDFHWMLNTHHGADYFRRWHSRKINSGGLMVHKATHHFDLVNWWLSAVPVTVQALGKKEFYTPEMAKRFGLESSHQRCLTCPEKSKCGFELDLASNKYLNDLYLNNEKYDGYYRDQCIFRPEIDIEDTMNVMVKYSNNVTLSYSLNAFNAWEGYYIIFNGTKGRLEHKMEEQVYISGDGNIPGQIKSDGTYIKIYPLRGTAYSVDVWKGEGGHGGGDKLMLEDIFLPGKKNDKYLRASDQRAGAYSALTGIAANHSFVTNKEVVIADLVKNIGMPEFPPMPSKSEKVPMPSKSVTPKTKVE